MPLTNPTPQTWTLRFKHHKTTLLLHVERTTPLQAIKRELLSALQSSNPSNTLHGLTLPSSPSQILLAKPLDFNNPDAGWEPLDSPSEELFDSDDDTPAAKKKKKAKSSLTDNPLGVGLKDGCAVAFRFANAERVAPASPLQRDVDEGLGLGVEEEEGRVEQEWDVVLPKYEDVYGLEDLVPDEELATPRPSRFVDGAAGWS